MFKNNSSLSAPLRQSIAAKIRDLMRQQGLTTETAALNMGLEYSNFYYIVTGKKTPRLETLIKIANGLNVRPEHFLNDLPQPNSAAKISSLKFNILKEIDKLKLPEQAFLLNVLKLRNVKSKI
ncbi:transcriptional regulator XRE family [Candidatus Termititenax aidoneus]|uniref:Transcriptional regulator XRE family n=1 Tax=Termititenax aidoneus TaxID=2218524 RepID=A0A388TB71_TERA1|nr:transcriptional regulator XRE family [Candidatus Termititenax aidoneus]